MTETTPTLRLWFMDWFGWMLDHNSLKDTISRTPFQVGRLPGLSASVALPFQLPCRPVLEKRISLPRPFPELEMQELSENHVVFFVPRTRTYLRSSYPGPDSIDFEAPEPRKWENFFPMTLEMLRGLSLILKSGTVRLTDETDHELLSNPSLKDGFSLQFGDRTLPLYLNTAALTQIGQIMPGNATTIALTWGDSTPPTPFTASREIPAEPTIP